MSNLHRIEQVRSALAALERLGDQLVVAGQVCATVHARVRPVRRRQIRLERFHHIAVGAGRMAAGVAVAHAVVGGRGCVVGCRLLLMVAASGFRVVEGKVGRGVTVSGRVFGGERHDARDNCGGQGNEQRHQWFKIVKRQFIEWPIKQID